jgi:AraC-like DNA-binding protein
MRYAEYPPSPGLASLVDCYWILEGPGAGLPEPIIPDGRIEIILHYGVHFERHHTDGRVERQSPAMLVGQILAPISVGYTGHAGVAAIRLRPAATRAVARCHAADLTGRFIDLDALFGPTETLREQIALAPDDGTRVRLLERWLASQVTAAPSPGVSATVDAIVRHAGTVDLQAMASAAGISLRQLERRFLADVGMPPKTFARIVRLQAALARIAAGETLADAAHGCGYYDQPHMTRDFSRLAETSPAAWRHHAGHLTPLFVKR